MPKRDEIRDLVGELHPDDGVPPPRRSGGGERRSSERKLRALCSQVRRTLELILPADLELRVRDVIPDADPARLIVLLESAGPPGELAALHARVEGLAPLLRREVAHAITRKRAPDLSYRISPARRGP
ncbi:MAG: hypothetical protein R3F62_30145 [Planctomycetota bacterium]